MNKVNQRVTYYGLRWLGTKGYFRTVMMLNFHAFEYSSGIAPSKVKKKNPNDLKLAHDMEWCHVPFAYQIGPGLI